MNHETILCIYAICSQCIIKVILNLKMSDEKEAETEYIEEELVVYADFGELLDEELLDEKDLNVQLIGIESETPILQLGGHVFRG